LPAQTISLVEAISKFYMHTSACQFPAGALIANCQISDSA
jgi:hypothetical protein